jgi:hypothetical protein
VSVQGNANAAKVNVILGSTGCGKTTELRRLLAKPRRRRTIIWSPKEPIDNYAALYPGSVVVRTAREVLEIAKRAGRSGEFHIVFVPSLNRKADEAQFGAVCKVAMAARDVTFIIDEAHTVTQPSWAPDGWSQLVMMGRGYGSEIFCLSQRPASMDKDVFGNASKVRTGRLTYTEDAKTVARALNVPWGDVMSLNGFQFIERDMLTGKTTRG